MGRYAGPGLRLAYRPQFLPFHARTERWAFRYNLALEIAPEYNRKLPDAVVSIAREAKASAKRLNSRTPTLQLDHLQLGARSQLKRYSAPTTPKDSMFYVFKKPSP